VTALDNWPCQASLGFAIALAILTVVAMQGLFSVEIGLEDTFDEGEGLVDAGVWCHASHGERHTFLPTRWRIASGLMSRVHTFQRRLTSCEKLSTHGMARFGQSFLSSTHSFSWYLPMDCVECGWTGSWNRTRRDGPCVWMMPRSTRGIQLPLVQTRTHPPVDFRFGHTQLFARRDGYRRWTCRKVG
jgi:hypothetical protein